MVYDLPPRPQNTSQINLCSTVVGGNIAPTPQILAEIEAKSFLLIGLQVLIDPHPTQIFKTSDSPAEHQPTDYNGLAWLICETSGPHVQLLGRNSAHHCTVHTDVFF